MYPPSKSRPAHAALSILPASQRGNAPNKYHGSASATKPIVGISPPSRCVTDWLGCQHNMNQTRMPTPYTSQPASVSRPASLIFANASSPLETGRVAMKDDNASDLEAASRASNKLLVKAQSVRKIQKILKKAIATKPRES
jgi:hypothetical protein